MARSYSGSKASPCAVVVRITTARAVASPALSTTSLGRLSSVQANPSATKVACTASSASASCEDSAPAVASDPPDGNRLLDWQRIESWRSWITRRLAFALVQARGSGAAPADCVAFALERLRMARVDTHTWSPTKDAWHEE